MSLQSALIQGLRNRALFSSTFLPAALLNLFIAGLFLLVFRAGALPSFLPGAISPFVLTI
jgi:hypothetical protein